MQRRIGIILINYNTANDTIECVESIEANDYDNKHVWIVDNASDTSSYDALEEAFDANETVTLVRSEENLGFGLANNLGMELAFNAGCDYALVLNNDTVVDKQLIYELSKHATPRTVVTPLMLYYSTPDVIWYAGGDIDEYGRVRHHGRGNSKASISLEPRETSFVTGCCMLLSEEAYRQTGGFSEEYFLYWEDADLSRRLLAKGFCMLLCPQAQLWHKVSSSTGGNASRTSDYYYFRNRLHFVRKFSYGMVARLAIGASWAKRVAQRGYDSKGLTWGLLDATKGIMGKSERFD